MMATEEFYRDEHPKPDTGGGRGDWASGGGGGGGGGWGGGGSGGGGDGGDGTWYLVGRWGSDVDLIIVNGEGLAVTDGLYLLAGGCCMKIEIEAQIRDYQISGIVGTHYDCVLLSAVPRKADGSAGSERSIFTGLLQNGEIDIYARWQKGHYNHSSIHTVRFRLKEDKNTITPWYHIPLGNAPGKKVMTLQVKDGILTAKSTG